MKIFAFLTLFFLAFSTNDPIQNGTENEFDKKVLVSVEYSGGFAASQVFKLSEILEMEIDEEFNEGKIFTCTVMFEGGECKVTASTCEAAMAGFRACACAAGYAHYCEEGD